jgi:protein-S-isoprenylcysteine O-methyltransferase Ste14
VITIPWAAVVALLSLGWLSGAFSGYMPTESLLTSLMFLVVFAAIPVCHYTHYKRQKAMTATGDLDSDRVIQGDGIFGLVYEKLTR